MVSNMSALQKLWLYKLKGKLRNLFSKKTSAIFTILIVLFYGAIFVSMFFVNDDMLPLSNMISVHIAVLLPIAFTALMVFMVLFQKRKALFFGEDAYYLFSGPFTKVQVMKYLISQTILQSIMFGAISVFIMVTLGSALALDAFFYILVLLVNAVITFFFLILTDYLYILSITNQKYKILSRVVAFSMIGVCIAIFLIAMMQNNFNINTALIEFVQSDIFYLVPLFGWGKLILIAYVEANYLMIGVGVLATSIATAIVYYFFIHFKGDFYEQALDDSIAYTEIYKQALQGKSASFSDKKVKKVNANFRNGAGALFSKGMLILRKTNGFINMKEVLILALYIAITWFTDLGFEFFIYMMMFFLMGVLQDSDLSQELKNYQIYLIPDHPLKKLIAIILPTLFKVIILVSVGVIIGALLFQTEWSVALQYLVMIYGYAMVFISATVLSLRVLKSRTNVVMENMLRMLIIIASAIPSIALTIYLIYHPEYFSMEMLNVISYSSLVLNFVVSIIILLLCKNMLNGRELNSD